MKKTSPTVAQNATATVPTKKEVTVLSTPTGNSPTNVLSINELKQKIQDEQAVSNVDLSNMPMEEFTKDQLLIQWRKYAYSLKDSDVPGANTVFKIMTQKDPELKEDVVNFKVENLVLYDLMYTNFSNEIIAHLRKELKNYGITLSIEIFHNKENEHHFMSGKERFEKMMQKNNNLLSLKKIFNLDIEY